MRNKFFPGLRAVRGSTSGFGALLFLAGLTAISSAQVARAEKEVLQNFEIKEYLDHDWSRELVFFALNRKAAAVESGKLAFLGPDDEEVPFQIVADRESKRMAFLADLPAGGTNTYTLRESAPERRPATDLKWDGKEAGLRLWNSHTGIEVPTSTGSFSNGPISAIRLRSGNWVGGSRLATRRKLVSYQSRVLARGPVFGEIECKYAFEDGKAWTIRFRVIAGEPVIVISETFDLGDDSRWELLLHPGFFPNHAAFRHGYTGDALSNDSSAVAQLSFEEPNSPFIIGPWINWSDTRAVSFIGLFRAGKGIRYIYDKDAGAPVAVTMPGESPSSSPDALEANLRATGDDSNVTLDANSEMPAEQGDVLFAATGHAADWARPGENGQAKAIRLSAAPPDQARFTLQLAGPGREWILGASMVSNTVRPSLQLAEPQLYMIKYCETPLREVLDMTLEWAADDPRDYPRISVSRPASNEKPSARSTSRPRLGRFYPVKLFTEAAIGSGWPLPSSTVYTHVVTKQIKDALFSFDQKLGKDTWSAEERARVRAQMAFVAYKTGSPHFYSVERNYRANPNMTTARHAVVGFLACMLPRHPMAKQWFDLGFKEIERQLAEWIGPNGGWLESPHYQITSIADHFWLLRAAHRAGFSDLLYDERLLKTMLYLAKISTPPDPRFGNFRHFPPAGNTYRNETSCMFSIFARLHQERNPEAADALQWTWLQQGRPFWRNIGGHGIINEYSKLLVADFEPQGPPNWKSELFPKSGAILRSGFPGNRETQLYLLQGSFDQHYDIDRGSFALWGKGQPLSLDWGYQSRNPAWQHNRLDIGTYGNVTEFSAQDSADYLHSVQEGWHRQILFVKDPDPLGPNFFLFRDWHSVKGKANWWLWLYTEESPKLFGNVVRMTGRADVDLDIWLAPPWQEKLARMTKKELADETPPETVAADTLMPGDGRSDNAETEHTLFGESELTRHVKTRHLALPAHTGFLRERDGRELPSHNGTARPLAQKGLHLEVPNREPLAWVLYPRLRDEKPPVFRDLADGKGVLVESSRGTDYAFLALEPFVYKNGPVEFEGTAGAIQARGENVTLSLGAAGRIRYRNITLSSEKPASKRSEYGEQGVSPRI